MKRATWTRAAMAGGLCLALAACAGPPAEDTRKAVPAADSGWSRTPHIAAARPTPGGLAIAGAAEPGARVVLRSAAGDAYAAAADARGRFEIRIAAPAGPLLLRPETQIGQDAAESPDRLLILDGGRGPVAVLRAGGPARRLDAAPALGAVDSDGRSVLASGRSETPDQPVAVSAGSAAAQVRPPPDGRWSVLLPATAGETFRVDGAAFVWPGPGGAAGELQVERIGGGWRIGWSGPGGARQWTWLPTGPAS